MHPTIRALLAESPLRLTLLERGADGALDLAVSWAHGSDLPDPTPFLDAGQILLTTGTQFLDGVAAPPDYVERLARAGIAGLGFGTEVATSGTPTDLVAACAAVGLPLFEVPYEVPFIAIARSIADSVAAAEHARDSWALGAMRAIAFAALKPDGLSATLDELARQLNRPVVLFDANGAAAHESPSGMPPEARHDVAAEARRLLARGQRSSSTVRPGADTAVLQTIGRRSELRGVLAVAGHGDLDASDQTVVTSVVALVGLALEQGREATRARAAVRSTAIRVLLDGRPDVARVVLGELGEDVPAGELAVVRLTSGAERAGDGLDDDSPVIRRALGERFAGALCADLDGTTVAIGPPRLLEDAVEHLASEANGTRTVRAGISAPADRGDLARADREARAALDATTARVPVLRSADLTARGVDWLLGRAESREIASAVLRPIAADPSLIASLEAWLEANGQTDPAARRLGVHRHTLRARISTIERLIDRDLASFEARTEAWIGLHALRSPPPA
jgi:purine catabolism regulator